jgi:hypothetical protein
MFDFDKVAKDAVEMAIEKSLSFKGVLSPDAIMLGEVRHAMRLAFEAGTKEGNKLWAEKSKQYACVAKEANSVINEIKKNTEAKKQLKALLRIAIIGHVTYCRLAREIAERHSQ